MSSLLNGNRGNRRRELTEGTAIAQPHNCQGKAKQREGKENPVQLDKTIFLAFSGE